MRLLATAGVFLLLGGMAWAKQPPEQPLYPALVATVANFGPGCHIKLVIPSRSEFPVTYGVEPGTGGASIILASLPFWNGEWFIGFTCYSKNSERAKDDLITWGETAERWIPNPDGWPLHPEMRFTIYGVETPNANGWAHTTDDTAIEETRAERRLRYCIYHGDRAICGGSTVGGLTTINRHPQADRTPYVLKILRSIQFLEDAPPEALPKK